jgi:hypothetical protein
VSNVHPGWNVGRLPYIWQVRERNEQTVLNRLENIYGKTDESRPFGIGWWSWHIVLRMIITGM